MGQVASVGQIHAEHRVAVLTQGGVHRIVGVGAAVGLHIGVVGPKELAGPFACDILHHVHTLAAAVIALSRITFGVLVRQKRTLSLHHCRRRVVFARNQLNVLFLTIRFGLNKFPDFAVANCDGVGVAKHVLGLLKSWARLFVPAKFSPKGRRNFYKRLCRNYRPWRRQKETTKKPAPSKHRFF